MVDKKGNKTLKHGDYPLPDGRVSHVLEVQDIFIDVNMLFSRPNNGKRGSMNKVEDTNNG